MASVAFINSLSESFSQLRNSLISPSERNDTSRENTVIERSNSTVIENQNASPFLFTPSPSLPHVSIHPPSPLLPPIQDDRAGARAQSPKVISRDRRQNMTSTAPSPTSPPTTSQPPLFSSTPYHSANATSASLFTTTQPPSTYLPPTQELNLRLERLRDVGDHSTLNHDVGVDDAQRVDDVAILRHQLEELKSEVMALRLQHDIDREEKKYVDKRERGSSSKTIPHPHHHHHHHHLRRCSSSSSRDSYQP